MSIFLYLFRFVYRIGLWLIICPLIATLIVILTTRNMGRNYVATTTIYTGIASGYSIDSENRDWNETNNAMDNLINIIRSKTTLKSVSMRLYAQHMRYGNSEQNNNYIKAENYRHLRSITPDEVLALVDKYSDSITVANLLAYEKASPDNFVYGLFNWYHPHYSYDALRNIEIKRLGASDMLEIKYTANDPGIAYHTLVILNSEFIRQYKELRFGETNNVIAYFEDALAKVGEKLRGVEDSLTEYNITKQIINYTDQTKDFVALDKEIELRYNDVLLAYNSSQALIKALEKRIEEHTKQIRNNGLFVEKVQKVSELTSRITTLESIGNDSLNHQRQQETRNYRKQLRDAQDDFTDFSKLYTSHLYSKEGIASTDLVEQWMSEVLRFEQAKAEREVLDEQKREIGKQYAFYSPVGSTIKRKEREINFTEQSYLSLLQSLNEARMKQKNLQMNSATLKVLSEPSLPISADRPRRAMVVWTFISSFMFVLGFFMVLEVLDRTLRDKVRTERLTSGKVLGAFSIPNKLRYRGYAEECNRIAAGYLANAASNYFTGKAPDIISLISAESGEGKSFISTHLENYWKERGLRVKVISWSALLAQDARRCWLAQSFKEICPVEDEDIIIVEYSPLNESPIPTHLLQQASLNLFIARANRAWKDTDQILFDRLKEQCKGTPLFIYLTHTKRYVTEVFTGLLPPFTFIRRVSYRIYQLGLTAD